MNMNMKNFPIMKGEENSYFYEENSFLYEENMKYFYSYYELRTTNYESDNSVFLYQCNCIASCFFRKAKKDALFINLGEIITAISDNSNSIQI